MVVFLVLTRALLSLCWLLVGRYAEAEFTVKENRICKFRKGKPLEANLLKVIKLGNNAPDLPALCEKKCSETTRCKGFELFGRKCSLVKNDVMGFMKPETKTNNNNNNNNKNNNKNKNKNKRRLNQPSTNENDERRLENRSYTCGMLMGTMSPTLSPTVSSPPTEPHSKVFEFDEDTRCKLLKGEKRKYKVYEDFSREKCDSKCGFRTKCKSYSWNPNLNECMIFNFRVKGTRKNKVGSVCARIPKATKAPVSPTPAPTPSPTKKPECKIQLRYAFPFDDPDDAPYYGGHADWLEVSKKNYKNDYACSSYYHVKDDNPGWCKYRNSKKDWDSTMVENLEDYYYTQSYLKEWEMVSSETITVKDAADHVTIVEAYHWLFNEDYYPDNPKWQDHMIVPGLTISNLSNDKQDKIGPVRKHPAKKYVSTHIKRNGNFIGNPNYEGNFRLEVHCNKFCRCEQKAFKTFGGFEDMRLLPGQSPHHPPRRLFHD